MVEGARLESVYTGNRIAGSNPALSASSSLSFSPQRRTARNGRYFRGLNAPGRSLFRGSRENLGLSKGRFSAWPRATAVPRDNRSGRVLVANLAHSSLWEGPLLVPTGLPPAASCALTIVRNLQPVLARFAGPPRLRRRRRREPGQVVRLAAFLPKWSRDTEPASKWRAAFLQHILAADQTARCRAINSIARCCADPRRWSKAARRTPDRRVSARTACRCRPAPRSHGAGPRPGRA